MKPTLYAILGFYFLSGIVMIVVGQFVLDDFPLVTAGFINAMVSSVIVFAVSVNEYLQSKSSHELNK